jgi:hypothetical protein
MRILALLLALTLTACGSSADAPDAPKAAESDADLLASLGTGADGPQGDDDDYEPEDEVSNYPGGRQDPAEWPTWAPTHVIEAFAVPDLDGKLTEFKGSTPDHRVEGWLKLDGKDFEIRSILFEGEQRVYAERVRCRWKEKGKTVQLKCAVPDLDQIALVEHDIERSDTGFTLRQSESSVRKVPQAPRLIVATEL